MRDFNIVDIFEAAAADLKLAKLTSSLMGGIREVHESDSQTLTRIVEEYRACKWEGIPIPEGKAVKNPQLEEVKE